MGTFAHSANRLAEGTASAVHNAPPKFEPAQETQAGPTTPTRLRSHVVKRARIQLRVVMRRHRKALTGRRRHRYRHASQRRPRHAIRLATTAADDELRNSLFVPDDDAAGGRCRGVPQARHGAEAGLRRWAAEVAPVPAQCMATTGCSRPRVERPGRAGWTARQLARSCTRGLRSAWRRTVCRVDEARKLPAARRPRRRSRAREEGRMKRAAGRAAYFAAMLCCMAVIVPVQPGIASTSAMRWAASGVSEPRSRATRNSRSPSAR